MGGLRNVFLALIQPVLCALRGNSFRERGAGVPQRAASPACPPPGRSSLGSAAETGSLKGLAAGTVGSAGRNVAGGTCIPAQTGPLSFHSDFLQGDFHCLLNVPLLRFPREFPAGTVGAMLSGNSPGCVSVWSRRPPP